VRTIDDMLNSLRSDGAERRLRAEFVAVPGLRLTPEQVQRRCGVERALCRLVLDALVDAKFLCLQADGHYAGSPKAGLSVHRPRRQTSGPNRVL
jgi:hypothetical protein